MSLFDRILNIIINIDNDIINDNEMKDTIEIAKKYLLYLKNDNIEFIHDMNIEIKRNNFINIYTLMLENIYENYDKSPLFIEYKTSNSIDFFHQNFLNLTC
jgi:hypothetical protein